MRQTICLLLLTMLSVTAVASELGVYEDYAYENKRMPIESSPIESLPRWGARLQNYEQKSGMPGQTAHREAGNPWALPEKNGFAARPWGRVPRDKQRILRRSSRVAYGRGSDRQVYSRARVLYDGRLRQRFNGSGGSLDHDIPWWAEYPGLEGGNPLIGYGRPYAYPYAATPYGVPPGARPFDTWPYGGYLGGQPWIGRPGGIW